jgi:hypothetical protein
MANGDDHDKVVRLIERVEVLVEGQGVIFKKLDYLMDRKTVCAMGETAHQDVVAELKILHTDVDMLKQQKATDASQRKTLYLVIVGSMAGASLFWAIITWVLENAH